LNKRIIIGAALLTLCTLSTRSQETIEYGPQVVLQVNKSENGTMMVVPQAKVWFRIGPRTLAEHPAPLPDGTLMLCRAYDLKATNGTFIGLRCGLDTYVVRSVGMQP
jgi:hypothetical protein